MLDDVGAFFYGNPVLGNRTPISNPYNHDPVLMYRDPYKPENVSTEYSDRLNEFNREKYEAAFKKYPPYPKGNMFAINKKSAQSFLREYFSDPSLVVHEIQIHCRQDNGYRLVMYVVSHEND